MDRRIQLGDLPADLLSLLLPQLDAFRVAAHRAELLHRYLSAPGRLPAGVGLMPRSDKAAWSLQIIFPAEYFHYLSVSVLGAAGNRDTPAPQTLETALIGSDGKIVSSAALGYGGEIRRFLTNEELLAEVLRLRELVAPPDSCCRSLTAQETKICCRARAEQLYKSFSTPGRLPPGLTLMPMPHHWGFRIKFPDGGTFSELSVSVPVDAAGNRVTPAPQTLETALIGSDGKIVPIAELGYERGIQRFSSDAELFAEVLRLRGLAAK